MPKSKTITLTLTEEEVELIIDSIAENIISLKDDIRHSEKYPESDYYGRAAAEAKTKLPVLDDLCLRIMRMELDAKFRC